LQAKYIKSIDRCTARNAQSPAVPPPSESN